MGPGAWASTSGGRSGWAFCLSAILTSICGTFYAQYVLNIDPPSTFGLMID